MILLAKTPVLASMPKILPASGVRLNAQDDPIGKARALVSPLPNSWWKSWDGRSVSTVLIASSAEFAEQMLLEATPDLIVLDIDMPERDGWSFAEDLRSGGKPNIPIIVISGHADEEGMAGAKMALHDAFLAKPFNLDDLLMQVAELLKVTLVLDSEVEADTPIAQDLTPEDRHILLESAAVGHPAGVRAHLAKLLAENRGATSLLDLIEKRLDRFDMGGIVEIPEATPDAAE